MDEVKNIRVIEVGGQVYHCTLSGRFRRHTPEELDGVRESVRVRGVQVPIRLYHDTDLDLGGCVLDGEGRLTVVAELDSLSLNVPTYYHGSLSTDEAYELAKTLNDCRRHDDPEAVRRRRQERIGKVAELRQEGKSLRAIADEVGVSAPQVLRDLEDAEEAGVTPVTPDRVTGQDGKTYPAASPEPEDRGDAWEPPEDGGSDDLCGSDADDELAPPVDTPPQPSLEASRTPARRQGPPPVLDKSHPFYDLLNALAGLSGRFTRAMASEHGAKLKDYLTRVQLQKPVAPRMVEHRAITIEGKSYGARFVHLRGLYRLVRMAGMPGNTKDAKLLAEFTKTGDDS